MRTILIIAVVFFGIRLIMRYLAPFLLNRFVRKQQEKFYGQQNAQENRPKDGSVNVKSRASSSKRNDNLGEYVDYEDLDESK